MTEICPDCASENLRKFQYAMQEALERIASETTEWDWDVKDGPNALVKILHQMRAEARNALAHK